MGNQKEDEKDSVVFVNPITANQLLKDGLRPDAMVLSMVIPEEDAVVVEKEEFLRWLYDKR